jgi:glycyl-tRNA synthetase alpha chain
VAYVQPSRRPADGRYGDNPFRLGKHYQLQVILKPSPDDVQALYVRSLEALGLDLAVHDLRFEEDNWEAPTLGAAGVGWQVMLDGMEITQFTYFQQAGGQELSPVSVEITYGLERLTMFLALARSVYDVEWVAGGPTYGQVRRPEEVELSRYYFELADVELFRLLFDGHEREAGRCLEAGLVVPAYECALKCSHAFNVLDARGAVSVTERVALIKRVRDLAVACARAWVESREALGFPLLGDRPEEVRPEPDAAPAEAAAVAGEGGGDDG